VFGITELLDRKVDSYSGGELRRLEIARALVSKPQVLFLDEPTVGLDPRIRHELLDVIAGLRSREEITILLTTHYLDEAQQLTDRVGIVHHGEIVALDRPEALLASLGEEILEFRVDGDAHAAARVLRAAGIAGADAFALGARVTVPLHGRPATQALHALEAERVRASEIHVRQPTLDDVYIQLTGSAFGEAA
jgi:ABC-2 type transport system ATP-binding protein